MIVLYRRPGQEPDAIDEYAAHLTAALRRTGGGARDGVSASSRRAHGGDLWSSAGRQHGSATAADCDLREAVVLWQYNPFSYGWRGIAPWAATLPLRLRTRHGARVCVTFHELYYPFGSAGAKGLTWAVAQRLQCGMIGASAAGLVATTGARAATLRRWFPWRAAAIRRVPVGSNVPVTAGGGEMRQTVRGMLGATGDDVLLGTFGSAGGGLQVDAAIRAVGVLRRQGIPAVLALLGRIAGTPERGAAIRRVAREASVDTRVVLPGPASAHDISHQLAALDVFLAPYDDGVSGRRTGLMAALAHALPIVGTSGRNTDADWFRPDKAVHFARSASPDHMAEAVAVLAQDGARRTQLSAGAEELYRREFSWDRIAHHYVDLVEGLRGPDTTRPVITLRNRRLHES